MNSAAFADGAAVVDLIIINRHAIPATLNYEGFPKSVCISINDEVCHGIPSPNRRLQEGDIMNVDVSTIYQGYYSDSSRMFCIGTVTEEKRNLVRTAKDSLSIGLKEVKPWGGAWRYGTGNS